MNTGKIVWGLAITLALGLLVASPGWAYDRTESEGCASCHFNPKMEIVADQWLLSDHANTDHGSWIRNTSCANCHSPFEGDAFVRLPVESEDWQAVTCASCHPPHDLRVAWGTPIAKYDVETELYTPLYGHEGANELCEHCHTGVRHPGEQDFKGWGGIMFEKKLVGCIDCHLASAPVSWTDGDDVVTDTLMNHEFGVGNNLPWSCGTYEGGCHSNHKEDWAAKQILKGKMHGKTKNHD